MRGSVLKGMTLAHLLVGPLQEKESHWQKRPSNVFHFSSVAFTGGERIRKCYALSADLLSQFPPHQPSGSGPL